MERVWCWEGLGAGGEGDDRGWDGWMASLTRWTLVSVNSGNWWWTGRPGVLRFMGSQRVRHDWATDLIWSDYGHLICVTSVIMSSLSLLIYLFTLSLLFFIHLVKCCQFSLFKKISFVDIFLLLYSLLKMFVQFLNVTLWIYIQEWNCWVIW